MQRNYVFGNQGFAKPQGNPYADTSGKPLPAVSPEPGRVYAGGSPNFNERTGQYQPPKQNQGGFQAYQQPAQPQGGFRAYRPGQAQPVNRSQGSPYRQPDVFGGGSMNERMAYPSMPYPQVPGYSMPTPGYGGGYGPGGVRTADFRDRDGDGVDDRDQRGPGMPYPQVPGGYQPAQQPSVPQMPQVVGGKMNRRPPPQRPPRRPQSPRWKGDMPMIEGRGLPPQFQSPPQFQVPAGPYSGGQLPPSSFTAQSFGPMGGVATPQQNMAQRDAFIAQLNNQRTPVAAAAGVYNTANAPVPPPISRDFRSMWGQAGNMVNSGWSNPLAGLFG